jgi:hypothetical protein
MLNPIMRTKLFLVFFFAVFLTAIQLTFAYPGGVSGRTLKGPNPGCTCHTGSTSTTVTLTITGPATLNAGQTGNYTVQMSGSSITGGGIDIAASTGTLATTDTKMKVLSGELTQSAAQSGSVPMTWSFKYTAPSTAGTQTLYATGCRAKNYWNNAPNFSVTVTPVNAVNDNFVSEKLVVLNQNYPNPFNPTTSIKFGLPEKANVGLAIYNQLGEKIATLVNGELSAGYHKVEWNASDMTSGIYFYEIKTDKFSAVKKLILMK